MKDIRPLLGLKCGWIIGIITFIAATPVLANRANFGTLNLAPGFRAPEGTVTGYTGGTYSLSAIANRDRNKKACIGFADTNPDHIMVLGKNFSRLRLQVNSGGSDTTLLVQGPNNSTILCGDDSGTNNKDASIDFKDWKAGTYRVWVGTFTAGTKRNYTLTVRE